MTGGSAHGRVHLLLGALLGAILTSSCVGPSRTQTDFRRKADSTVDDVRGAVQTAVIGIQAADRHSLPAAYISVLLGDAEEDASSAADTFAGIQPPDERSDRIRQRTLNVVDEAVDELSEARIVARRGDHAALTPMLPHLRVLARQLDELSTELDGPGR